MLIIGIFIRPYAKLVVVQVFDVRCSPVCSANKFSHKSEKPLSFSTCLERFSFVHLTAIGIVE